MPARPPEGRRTPTSRKATMPPSRRPSTAGAARTVVGEQGRGLVTAVESFELSIEDLRKRRGVKWLRFPPDVIPAWVADMDFTVPEPVQEAIEQIVRRQEYGYGNGHGLRDGDDSLAAAFAEHMRDHFGWDADPAGVVPVSELIQAMFTSINAFSEPGDGIVVQTPIYPPFLNAIDETGRRLVENRLHDDGARYIVDVEGLRQVVTDPANRVRMLM